jgi:hypothetical protein
MQWTMAYGMVETSRVLAWFFDQNAGWNRFAFISGKIRERSICTHAQYLHKMLDSHAPPVGLLSSFGPWRASGPRYQTRRGRKRRTFVMQCDPQWRKNPPTIRKESTHLCVLVVCVGQSSISVWMLMVYLLPDGAT